MKIESISIELNGKHVVLSPETTRNDLIQKFGEPEDIGAISRKNKRGLILKYDEIEFHFRGDRDESLLYLVYREKIVNGEHYPELSVLFGEVSSASR